MNIAKELEAVLLQEKRCLLTGNFAGLASLVERKIRLSDLLSNPEFKTDLPEVEKLAFVARQNEALLISALRGIKAALAQITEAAKGSSQTTYLRTGEKQFLTQKQRNLEQKI